MDDHHHHHHDMYTNLHPTAMDYSQFLPSDYSSLIIHSHGQNDVAPPPSGPPLIASAGGSIVGLSDDATSSSDIKAKIASHPRYPRLLQSYIDCHKVGAPPEIEKALDGIRRDNELRRRELGDSITCLGADPLLDDFMESYCEILEKYKADLAKPVNEATSFINDVETQLRHLCNYQGATSFNGNAVSTGGGALTEEEDSEGEEEKSRNDEEKQLKDELLRRFGSHISSLKLEFSKKKKKGKLPREARQMLFEWWNAHYKWPYPTESDKIALAEMTGLDPRQINNWFINQRKRHWKPSENMHFAFVNNTSTNYFTNDS